MGILSIVGRLSLDGSSFNTGLKSAEKSADQFSKKLRNQVAGVAGGFVGVNALKQMALAAMESTKEITQLANRFNLTTDEVQLLQAESDKTGTSFEKLVENATELESTLSRLKGGNVIFDANSIQALETAREVIGEFKAGVQQRFAEILGASAGRLTPRQTEFMERDIQRKRQESANAAAQEKQRVETEDKIAKMQRETAELRDQALPKEERLAKLQKERAEFLDKRGFSPNTPESVAENDLKEAQLNAAIAKLSGGGSDSVAESRAFSPISDSLTSVGNFLGTGANSPAIKAQDEANRLLRQIERNTSTQTGGGPAFPL